MISSLTDIVTVPVPENTLLGVAGTANSSPFLFALPDTVIVKVFTPPPLIPHLINAMFIPPFYYAFLNVMVIVPLVDSEDVLPLDLEADPEYDTLYFFVPIVIVEDPDELILILELSLSSEPVA
ncbi:MAG: hypothetical protein HDQ98_03400 [Lachnospiraceae bacterium]|nr:hypothetical protein [Lachnospiraceae bacterium]